jgi:hypothetical protein
MNESITTSSAATYTAEVSFLKEQEVSSLKALQDILHNRIKQKKGEMHESHNRAYTDNLWREIETLHWMLI